ncbi:integral membrane protein S linking to the trans Golgi network-domain-containing protein [Rhodocollybia butyracea]|uniref:Integral membrane protein S linking to the trans Golgi network-domain-containing protein n=1 Tax=Rhodocollybia butyracea TaxID=206335 RepID=A0A9P5PM38_9AGAR|nr:integral membrane protein S linking to the trans Golgi network-domain-containing protein [Rhodocollybia butyracea]
MSSPSLNWDPALLISQIVSMQTLHYLILSLFIPPLLTVFAEPTSLAYEGGASNVGMIMDWREMAGRPTVRGIYDSAKWGSYSWAWSGGKILGFTWREEQLGGGMDPIRGWIIAFCWLLACSADIYFLYIIVRRPRLILDFAVTLAFNHLVLTTYYSSSVPTSLFFWAIVFAGTTMTVIIAEQLCVKREMNEGLSVAPVRAQEEEELEELELGQLLPRRD